MTAAADEYDDDYDDYYDDEEDGVSGFVVLVVALVVLIVFSAVVWFAYQRGLQDRTVPIVAANPEPVKTEQPLTFEDTPERQEVYDTLEGNRPTQVVVDATGENDPLEGFDQTASASGTRNDPITSIIEEPVASDTEPVVSEPVTTAPEPAPTPVASQPVQEDTPPARPAPQPTTRPEPQPTRPAVTAGSALSGSHVVQVGAFRSDEEARGYFQSMSTKLGAVVGNKVPDVQVADLGSRGVYYRLRVGPFSSKDAAATYCNQLKTRGQDCLVKTSN